MIDLLQDSLYLLNDPVAQQAALEIRQVKLTACYNIAFTHQGVLGQI